MLGAALRQVYWKQMQNESQQTKNTEFYECKMEIKFLAATLVQFEESGATLEQF